MQLKKFLTIFLLLFFANCSHSTKQDKIETAEKEVISMINDSSENEYLVRKEKEFAGYLFRFGYYLYDEDSFGFQNPGFLEIYKNGKLLYTDSVKGYEEMNLSSLGYHQLVKRMLVFSLDFGLEACDYPQNQKLYGISENDKVYFIDEFRSQSTDYASAFFQQIFPEETNGIKNHLLLIEGIHYKEGDEKDIADTSFYYLVEDGFKKLKQPLP